MSSQILKVYPCSAVAQSENSNFVKFYKRDSSTVDEDMCSMLGYLSIFIRSNNAHENMAYLSVTDKIVYNQSLAILYVIIHPNSIYASMSYLYPDE